MIVEALLRVVLLSYGAVLRFERRKVKVLHASFILDAVLNDFIIAPAGRIVDLLLTSLIRAYLLPVVVLSLSASFFLIVVLS